MKKWLNTFFLGDKKTKWVISAIIVCSILGIVLAILCITEFSLFYGIGAVAFGVIDGIILQKYSLEETVYEQESGNMTPLDNEIEETEEREINWEKETPEEEETIYTSFGEKKMEQLFKKYKVKQNNRRIIIDSCASFRIRQCPAYIWKEKKYLRLLLLEKEPRAISIPLKEITDIYYESGVLAKEKEYEIFQKPSYIASLFSPFLPQYYEKLQGEEKKSYKNLYIINPKLKVTNTSARNLFDILDLEFGIEDAVMESTRYSPYFKLAYKSNVLLRDRVIDIEEYKERIKMILTVAAEDEDCDYEYNQLINQLMENKLITKEYADYYQEMKNGL